MAAMKLGLSQGFKNQAAVVENPYGDGDAAERMFRILKDYDFSKGLQKPFYDVSFTER